MLKKSTISSFRLELGLISLHTCRMEGSSSSPSLHTRLLRFIATERRNTFRAEIRYSSTCRCLSVLKEKSTMSFFVTVINQLGARARGDDYHFPLIFTLRKMILIITFLIVFYLANICLHINYGFPKVLLMYFSPPLNISCFCIAHIYLLPCITIEKMLLRQMVRYWDI